MNLQIDATIAGAWWWATEGHLLRTPSSTAATSTSSVSAATLVSTTISTAVGRVTSPALISTSFSTTSGRVAAAASSTAAITAASATATLLSGHLNG